MPMRELILPIAREQLAARLQVPGEPRGTVVFVHGSGVDRHDARDAQVARALGDAGFTTLQPELLDERQALERHDAFDIELQCQRLLRLLGWLEREPWAGKRPLGFFASGVGAGIALLAAAKRPERAGAVVCRGGRPDAALFCAPLISVPTLLLVEEDRWPYRPVYDALGGQKELQVVATASGRFDEPEAAQAVAQHAARWFSRHLAGAGSPAALASGGARC
jgi:putative phosphoribosyl transferase